MEFKDNFAEKEREFKDKIEELKDKAIFKV